MRVGVVKVASHFVTSVIVNWWLGHYGLDWFSNAH